MLYGFSATEREVIALASCASQSYNEWYIYNAGIYSNCRGSEKQNVVFVLDLQRSLGLGREGFLVKL